MGVPTLVHESNAIPGKAVKKLAPHVDCVMTNFRSTTEAIKGAKRLVRVGNPTLFEIGDCTDTAKSGADSYKRKVILFGGSGGSETMNDGIVNALCNIADKYSDTEFYHASGKRDFERMKNVYKAQKLAEKNNVVLTDYIYDMNERMAAADLVVCRAGAMTISELALLGKAAIFVPSPYVVANHQYKNAKAIYDKGACELVEEKDFESGRLGAVMDSLLSDKVGTAALGEKIKDFADKDANEKIYLEIKNLLSL